MQWGLPKRNSSDFGGRGREGWRGRPFLRFRTIQVVVVVLIEAEISIGAEVLGKRNKSRGAEVQRSGFSEVWRGFVAASTIF